ncbi:MAG: hypothetical protein KDB07_02860, partial [Planctomycetes bacterium]|nr:hypothetical protein [Planctomycetota bacterium]
NDQVRASGAILLSHHLGPTIASIQVTGFADVRDGDLERAEKEAIENLWAVHQEAIRNKLREAFPPIMR